MRRAHATPLGAGARPPRQPIMSIMSRQGVIAAASTRLQIADCRLQIAILQPANAALTLPIDKITLVIVVSHECRDDPPGTLPIGCLLARVHFRGRQDSLRRVPIPGERRIPGGHIPVRGRHNPITITIWTRGPIFFDTHRTNSFPLTALCGCGQETLPNEGS